MICVPAFSKCKTPLISLICMLIRDNTSPEFILAMLILFPLRYVPFRLPLSSTLTIPDSTLRTHCSDEINGNLSTISLDGSRPTEMLQLNGSLTLVTFSEMTDVANNKVFSALLRIRNVSIGTFFFSIP